MDQSKEQCTEHENAAGHRHIHDHGWMMLFCSVH